MGGVLMAYRFRSSDGLMKTNDPKAIRIWEEHADRERQKQSMATAALLELGVKLEHPDDGWVDRERGILSPCYSRFDLGPCVGDRIALGWPWKGYRIVRVTRVEVRKFLTTTVSYHFQDDGERLDFLES